MTTKLSLCDRCTAFLPRGGARCPHCGAAARVALPRWIAALATVGGGGLLSMTLAACYGGGCAGQACRETYYPVPVRPVQATENPPLYECTPEQDRDQDGHCGIEDCDDGDPEVHAHVVDTPGDGIDRDCDGTD